ncbi:flagellar basal-body rod protein FlgG [Salsuginibacillus halophilus]|uniref:Flagellar basal-body rod protein FlgG n=1 Tax=Salsuginibacillus halophilus TaxID=517424 RepID=A0A2P8HHR1_9BACI|nr:flagellar hook-basal body protein [Salsuginibacillus halophilus]PSL45758.1 flagellar basal-body rod protein FlgG [Salsuginibacillus halophilus]
MLRGFYGAGAGMITQQRHSEMLNNNLANAQTPGYKGDNASIRSFPEMLMQAENVGAAPGGRNELIGSMNTGTYMQERTPNFAQGDTRQTENNTDMAIVQGDVPVNEEGNSGALFFNVANEDGDLRYTRNGSFAVDGEGFLTTAQGNYVLDDAGDEIFVNNEEFTVDAGGNVFDDDGEELATIDISFAAAPEDLVKEGDGLLAVPEDEDALPTAIGDDDINYDINQGFVEESNVDLMRTMSDMMESMRIFEANQTVLQAYDQSMERAVNDVGRLQ